jgi:hypothetical protein
MWKMHNEGAERPGCELGKILEAVTVRINIESVFEQFDSQLAAALAKAAVQTVPGMTTKAALRLYGAFRRNAIVALSPWEKVPATALSADSITGAHPPADGGIALPEEDKPRR